MRSLLPTFVAALLPALAAAQTTGVALMNDYTINGLTAGSTSCTTQCHALPVTLTMNVSTRPGNPVFFFWTACPCAAGTACWFPNFCVPLIPICPPPCGPGTNQSIDLNVFGCPIILSVLAFADNLGNATLTMPIPAIVIPPCSAIFSTQALVIDPCGTGGIPPGPGPFVLTQAYEVQFG